MNHIQLGIEGELLAKKYLIANNMVLCAANYRWKRQEIDLVFIDQSELVFVEVKTRTHEAYGAPEQAISITKQRHLISAANGYIQEKEIDLDARFDVVSVIYNTYETRINHIKNAFYPTL
jgi:putative endonuclease